MKSFLRKLNNLFLFFRYVDFKYIFSGIEILFLQFLYYLCKGITTKHITVGLFKNAERIISFRKIKFSISAIPNDLGYIFETFIKKSYESIESFIPKDGDACLDIGANIGDCALSWYRNNFSGRIFCCEPYPLTFNRLQKNINLNNCKNIEVLPIAISDRNEPIEIIVNDVSSMATIDSTKAGFKHTVQAHTLDYLVKEKCIDKINICKIDVEGHEIAALKGAKEALKITKKLIIEYHSLALKQQVKEVIKKNFEIIKVTGCNIGLIFAERRN